MRYFPLLLCIPLLLLPGNVVGMAEGEGRIVVIPSAHPSSIKDGETLTITDVSGDSMVDRSLRFSDPAARNSTPGTTDYPNGGMLRLDSITLSPGEHQLQCGVFDFEAGYGYFGTGTTPGMVVKIALGDGDDPPVWVGSAVLSPDEGPLVSAVIDSTGQTAYFATDTSPGRVVKVALGEGDEPPYRIGAVTLAEGEDSPLCAVYSSVTGTAYFGTNTIPGRVVMVSPGETNQPPVRLGGITLPENIDHLTSAFINQNSGHLYFGTNTSPGLVVKFRIEGGNNPPVLLGSLTLGGGFDGLISGAIDTTNGHGFFGTNTVPGQIVKVGLGEGDDLPGFIGSTVIDSAEPVVATSLVANPMNGSLYAGVNSDPGQVAHCSLGAGNAPPLFTGFAVQNVGEGACTVVGYRPSTGHVFSGTRGFPGRVVKLDARGGSVPVHLWGVTLSQGDQLINSGVFLDRRRRSLFGTFSNPGRAVGALSRNEILRLQRMSHGRTFVYPQRYSTISPMVVQNASSHVYTGVSVSFGDQGEVRSHVVKLGEGGGARSPGSGDRRQGPDDGPMVLLGDIELEPEEYPLGCAVIDEDAGYAYFGTSASGEPGRVVKVALGEGDDPPVRIGAVTLEANETGLGAAVIDTVAGYAYFGTSTSPARVVKVALGVGDDAPVRVGVATMDPGEAGLTSAVIDTAAGYAYFGTSNSPRARVVKVALGEGSDPPARVGGVLLENGEGSLRSAVIDTVAGFAYFGTFSAPGRVVKVALGDGDDPPVRVAALALGTGEVLLSAGVHDREAGHAWFGTFTIPARVVRVALGQQGVLKSTRFTLPEDGRVEDVRLYSHRAAGNLRMALYNNDEPKQLLWESPAIANTSEEEELVVAIGDGMPTSLVLTAGTYWVAWQSDSHEHVTSYTPGEMGDGFAVPLVFGNAPGTLRDEEVILTSERWTQYITYDTDIPTPTPTPIPTATPTVTPTPNPLGLVVPHLLGHGTATPPDLNGDGFIDVADYVAGLN